ncbi:hypothetical protein [Mycolicibacterium sp. XJ870]
MVLVVRAGHATALAREGADFVVCDIAAHIVATSSIVAGTGATNSGHYAAAKAGVVALVKSVAP